MTLFTFAIVQPPQLYTHLELTLRARSLFVGRLKYGDKVKADATVLDMMRGMSIQPTADPLPTRFTSFLSTFPCLPVHLYTVYSSLPTSELFLSSCFLALYLIYGRSYFPLGT